MEAHESGISLAKESLLRFEGITKTKVNEVIMQDTYKTNPVIGESASELLEEDAQDKRNRQVEIKSS